MGVLDFFSKKQETLTLIDDKEEKEHHHGSYGNFVAYCFTVNYILGVGVLGVPGAFQQAGLIFGVLFLFLVTLIATIAVSWIVEAMSRAEAITTALEKKGGDINETGLINVEPPEYKITDRKFEVNELCEIFMGKSGLVAYQFCISLYLYGGLMSYVSVFGQSMAAHVPMFVSGGGWMTCDPFTDSSAQCDTAYVAWVCVFACIVVPLTCLDMTEQKAIQVFMAFFRFIALFVMIVVAFVAASTDPFSKQIPGQDYVLDVPLNGLPFASAFPLFSLAGFLKMCPVALYSQIMHHSAPGIVQPVRNKTKLLKVFSSVFATTFTFYAVLGVALVMYYGAGIENPCSLNFAHYLGGVTRGSPVPGWAQFISFLVVLFPAVDVCSAFPLNAITLGNNLMMAINPDLRRQHDTPRRKKIPFRLLASIPPMVAAALMKNLETILQYSGLVGFIIAFVFPGFLLLTSTKASHDMFGGPEKDRPNPYTTFFSKKLIVYFVIVFALTALVLCLVAIADPRVVLKAQS